MKNLLTQWETEEKNQKSGGNMPLIDKKHSDDVLLIDSKHSGNLLLINRKLAELKHDAECVSLLKLTELVKKPSKRAKTGKEKSHYSIFYFLAYFDEPVGRSCFCFAKGLAYLTDSLAMGGAKLRREKVAVGFFA